MIFFIIFLHSIFKYKKNIQNKIINIIKYIYKFSNFLNISKDPKIPGLGKNPEINKLKSNINNFIDIFSPTA